MASLEITFLQNELEERRNKLETVLAQAPRNSSLAALLQQVDSALERMKKGSYGLCEVCQEPVEANRLMADPLVRYCLDHLNQAQRDALQRDLDLASEVQRKLLPQANLRVSGWETSYYYAAVGPVSGDYCDLIPSDNGLFFVLGDVSGKGVAASMLMTQLHALFRSLTAMALPLTAIVSQANRVFCESALAGQYATLVCGRAMHNGRVEVHNAGHWPAILVGDGGVRRIESSGLPVGMFLEGEFCATYVELNVGDTLFLYTDGLPETRSSSDEYGADRLTHLVRDHADRSAAELIAACVHDLRTFSGDTPRLDDLTLLAIRRTL
ncbi:MAG: SpoIIE family protein phosphatase [Acidobacteria bacterium]|nr:SpoIIE family protein phosphatase [Acidobacteriota bacterium]MBV9624956.1 SpoIIE family protein phosphatase [Acidobacteriota bacterium]